MSTSNDSDEYWWLRKVSEHGLGHLLSPLGPADKSKRWRDEGWSWVMGRIDRPAWFHLPAVSRISVSSPFVLRAFEGINANRSVDERIRPFNFCLSAHIAPFGHPEGVDPTRFHLIAPYSDDPSTYLSLDWVDRFTGNAYPVATQDDARRPRVAILQTYESVFWRYARHMEAKSLDQVGTAGRGSGLLLRRPLREGSRALIGKESNRIEEAEMSFWHRLGDVLQEYATGDMNPWRRWVIPVLQAMPLRELMEASHLDRRTLQRIRNGHSKPRPRNQALLTSVAGHWAKRQLGLVGRTSPRSDVLACRAWVEIRS